MPDDETGDRRGERRRRGSTGGQWLWRILLVCTVGAIPAAASAQQAGARLAPLMRVDLIVARTASVHAGAGLELPLGNYVRVGPTLSAGATRIAGDRTRATGRLDLVARFLVDPFGEYRWGPYAGGGASILRDANDRGRGVVVLVAGIEGASTSRVRTALELGLGGGTRVGLVLRRGSETRRR